MSEPRPTRMYSPEDLAKRTKPLWDRSHWIQYVEDGKDRNERMRRLDEVPGSVSNPDSLRAQVRVICIRRITRVLRAAKQAEIDGLLSRAKALEACAARADSREAREDDLECARRLRRKAAELAAEIEAQQKPKKTGTRG